MVERGRLRGLVDPQTTVLLSPISELHIFIFDDSYIAQGTPASCRAPAAIRG